MIVKKVNKLTRGVQVYCAALVGQATFMTMMT